MSEEPFIKVYKTASGTGWKLSFKPYPVHGIPPSEVIPLYSQAQIDALRQQLAEARKEISRITGGDNDN